MLRAPFCILEAVLVTHPRLRVCLTLLTTSIAHIQTGSVVPVAETTAAPVETTSAPAETGE